MMGVQRIPDPCLGEQFSMLMVLENAHRRNNQPACLVECICGNQKIVTNAQLRTGATVSCGCKRKNVLASQGVNNATHGVTRSYTRSPEWNIWASMRQRCENPNNRAYAYYGGRGIRVCERWSAFENFYSDMGQRPADHLSIDRINPDGDYEPSNCRWATPLEQRHNRSQNLRVSV